MKAGDGERSAATGLSGQYRLAARLVLDNLPTLTWVRVADPAAGIADDFQWETALVRHALQAKWSQYPGPFTWGDLLSASKGQKSLFVGLVDAWRGLRSVTAGTLRVHLCSNNVASTASPPITSPLASATAQGPRHFAAFLARAVVPTRRRIDEGVERWAELAAFSEVEQWSEAWGALRLAAQLSDDDFVSFVRDLRIELGLPSDLDHRDGTAAFEADVDHVAGTLQALVSEPERRVHLSKAELLDRLGWSGRAAFRHHHKFPVPELYEVNEAARAKLLGTLADVTSGYVGLLGPAGSGKSTLLESMAPRAHVVRYYAFIPDAPDPLSHRGEAESFLHDLSLALEEDGLSRPGYGHNNRVRHRVLEAQLERAGERWRIGGLPTAIIIDGLDHIAREQNPMRSLLDELPGPTALPEGVIIVLGSQTADVLPTPIREALAEPGRTVDVPPLSPDETGRLADRAGPGEWLSLAQRSALIDASEGHPLALTYLLGELSEIASAELSVEERSERAQRCIADACAYGGDVEKRYRGYFQAADTTEVQDLLAIVARLRSTVDLDWLASWARPEAVGEFALRTAAFFHHDGRLWRFVHNSFRRFLADQTALAPGGTTVDPARDRALHARIADLCAESSGDWRRYRDEEIAHRLLAGQHHSVIALSEPTRLRAALVDLHPLETIRRHAVTGLESAAATDDQSAFVRQLLFINELTQRGYALEASPLADTVLKIEPINDAIDHLVAGGELRVRARQAIEWAAHCARTGDTASARGLLRAVGGLPGLVHADPGGPIRDTTDSVADWAETTWHLSGIDVVLPQLDAALPHEPDDAGSSGADQMTQADSRRADIVLAGRCAALARCVDLAADIRDDDALYRLTVIVDREMAPDWRARLRVVRARTAMEDGDTDAVVAWVQETHALEVAAKPTRGVADERTATASSHPRLALDLRLAVGELLIKAGMDDEQIERFVPRTSVVAWPSPFGSDEFDAFGPVLAMLRLSELRAHSLTRDPIVQPRHGWSPGAERFRQALSALARIEAQQVRHDHHDGAVPPVVGWASPIIRLLEVPVAETVDWTGWHMMRRAASGLLRRLVECAALAGGGALSRLLDAFDDAWTTPVRAGYWFPEQRHAVLTAVAEAGAGAEWVHFWLETMESDLEGQDDDPHHRVDMWLAHARAWAAAGDSGRARRAARRAVEASFGIGLHDDDRQLCGWLEWLAEAAEQMSASETVLEVQRYRDRLARASAVDHHHAEAAAERLCAIAWASAPGLACDVAETLVEEGALGEVRSIEVIALAAARDMRPPTPLVAALAVHLLAPVTEHLPTAVLEAVHARDSNGDSAALIDHARAMWSIWDPPADAASSTSASDQRDDPPSIAPRTTAPANSSPGAMLTALRRARTPSEAPPAGWEATAEAVLARGATPAATARTLLEQATRLRLGGRALGLLACLAARSGTSDAAVDALAENLGRLPGYGWLRRGDGGTRLELFGAALSDRSPELVRLAAMDLAAMTSGGTLAGQLQPSELMTIVRLLFGTEAIVGAWPDVVGLLDHLAPVGAPAPAELVETSDPAAATLRFASAYLGHPVRELDYGARAVFRTALTSAPQAVQPVLARAIERGGWPAEAALSTIIDAEADHGDGGAHDSLILALQGAVLGPDAIVRDLAREAAAVVATTIPTPSPRSLALAYGLATPPLRDRRAPELDPDGVPYLDRDDPRQVLAPFDEALELLARMAGLDESAVLYRAATLSGSPLDPWLRAGHRAQADRLKRRGQTHQYRPWAFMVGRRAVGLVLGELLDADRLDLGMQPARQLGLIDRSDLRVASAALHVTTPFPWRDQSTAAHDTRSWCDEVALAATVYAAGTTERESFVLGAYLDVANLEWGQAREERYVRTHHRFENTPNGLVQRVLPAWETARGPIADYPYGLDLDWADQELVIRVRSQYEDPPYLTWLALHPSVADGLGWVLDRHEALRWNAPNGSWRARSVHLRKGLLSHRPPRTAFCAEGWEVIISEAGRAEMEEHFEPMRRRMTVERTVPANRREQTPERSSRAHAAILDGLAVAYGSES